MSTGRVYAEFEDASGNIRVVEETDTITTLDLEGEFDASLSPEISEHAHHILSDGKHLIIDLSKAVFIDSSVIHALFNANAAAQAKGRCFVLQLGTATAVLRVITITATDTRLVTAQTRADAIKVIYERSTNASAP